jgi:hypothetical protein
MRPSKRCRRSIAALVVNEIRNKERATKHNDDKRIVLIINDRVNDLNDSDRI